MLLELNKQNARKGKSYPPRARYWEFWNSSSINGSEFLHDVTQPAIDYSPVQVNDTTYRYIWNIVIYRNADGLSIPPGLYWVDAATGEIVPQPPRF